MQKFSIKRILIGLFIGIVMFIVTLYLWSRVPISIRFKAGTSIDEAGNILKGHDISLGGLTWGGGPEGGYKTVVSIPRILLIFKIKELREDSGIKNVEKGKHFFLPPEL